MSATWELFKRWKARMGHESNNAAASDLGTARQTVQNWKDGRNGDAHFIERMAKDLGEDPVPVILEAFSEAARDAEARRTLQRLAKRFRGPALALALGALPLMAPSASTASPVRPEGHSGSAGVVIMRTRHRSRRGTCTPSAPSRRRSNRKWKSTPPAFRCSA